MSLFLTPVSVPTHGPMYTKGLFLSVRYWWDIGHNPETLNPFKPEFTIVIFIHYKPRIAAAILDL